MIYFGNSSVKKIYFGAQEVQKMYLGNDLIYSAQPQLATPTNLSVTDTTASFDEVENAESYEFFVDDVSIGEYSTLASYTVTINKTGDTEIAYLWNVYDGTDDTGTHLGALTSGSTPETFTISSGHISIMYPGASDEQIDGFSATGGVSNIQDLDGYGGHILADVSGDGTISLEFYVH